MFVPWWHVDQVFDQQKQLDWQFFVTFLGWLSDPFQCLSDLQLWEEKVTLKHLVTVFFNVEKDDLNIIVPSPLY